MAEQSQILQVERVRGILFDLDGVLYVDDGLVAGALEAVAAVRAAGLRCRFITNTTTRSPRSLLQKLQRLGFAIEAAEVFSVVSAARDYLQAQGGSAHLLMSEEVRSAFEGIEQDNESPDYVVVGDIGEAWDYALLNRVYGQLLKGAKLVALHKNKSWQSGAGLKLDIGLFVAGLEYVSGQEALVLGKPSPGFFRLALESLALPPEQVLMVGDDIESDVGGAQRSGIAGVLVRTGKYREVLVAQSSVVPTAVINSVAELPKLLQLS